MIVVVYPGLLRTRGMGMRMITKIEAYNAYRVVKGLRPVDQLRGDSHRYFNKIIVELFIAAFGDDPRLPEYLARIQRHDQYLFRRIVERLNGAKGEQA